MSRTRPPTTGGTEHRPPAGPSARQWCLVQLGAGHVSRPRAVHPSPQRGTTARRSRLPRYVRRSLSGRLLGRGRWASFGACALAEQERDRKHSDRQQDEPDDGDTGEEDDASIRSEGCIGEWLISEPAERHWREQSHHNHNDAHYDECACYRPRGGGSSTLHHAPTIQTARGTIGFRSARTRPATNASLQSPSAAPPSASAAESSPCSTKAVDVVVAPPAWSLADSRARSIARSISDSGWTCGLSLDMMPPEVSVSKAVQCGEGLIAKESALESSAPSVVCRLPTCRCPSLQTGRVASSARLPRAMNMPAQAPQSNRPTTRGRAPATTLTPFPTPSITPRAPRVLSRDRIEAAEKPPRSQCNPGISGATQEWAPWGSNPRPAD